MSACVLYRCSSLSPRRRRLWIARRRKDRLCSALVTPYALLFRSLLPPLIALMPDTELSDTAQHQTGLAAFAHQTEQREKRLTMTLRLFHNSITGR